MSTGYIREPLTDNNNNIILGNKGTIPYTFREQANMDSPWEVPFNHSHEESPITIRPNKKITCFSFTSGDRSDEGGSFFLFFYFLGCGNTILNRCNTIKRLDPDDEYMADFTIKGSNMSRKM